MGIYLAQSREEKEVQRLSQSDPTTAAYKVKASVTAPIILNTLYTSFQWPYIPSMTVLSVSSCRLLSGHYLLMTHVCFCVYSDGRFFSICSPARSVLVVHTLTSYLKYWLSCMLTKWRYAQRQMCGWKRDQKRGDGEDKEVLIYQHNEDLNAVRQVQCSKVAGVSGH